MLVALIGIAVPLSACCADGAEVLFLTDDSTSHPLVAGVARDLKVTYRARVTFAGPDARPAARPDVAVVIPSVRLPDPEVWSPPVADWAKAGTGLVVLGVPTDFGECARLWTAFAGLLPARVAGGQCFGEWRAQWIWTPPGEDETPDHHRYVRKVFEVAETPANAWVRMTADNLYTAHINGVRFGYHWSWFDAELWDVTDFVRRGKNVLAVDARNVDGPGGLLCEIGIEYVSGKTETIISDGTWKMSRSLDPGWAAPDFDDASWPGPRQVRDYPASWAPIPDRPASAEGTLRLAPHACTQGIARRFGRTHELRGLCPEQGASVVAEVRGDPVLIVGEAGRGRVAVANGLPGRGSVLEGDSGRDLVAQTILWAAGSEARARFVRFSPPEDEFTVGEPEALPTWSAAVERGGRHALRLQAELHRADGNRSRWVDEVPVPLSGLIANQRIPLRLSSDFEGDYVLTLTLLGADGAPVAARHATFGVVNVVNARLSVPANRYVTAGGYPITFRAEVQAPDEAPRDPLELSGEIIDPLGEAVHRFPPGRVAAGPGPIEWTYQPPNLECGQYVLRSAIADAEGRVVDTSELAFWVVPPLDLDGFFPTTMRLSPFRSGEEPAIEREIDDIIAHGFNTLTFSAHRLNAEPGSPYDHAEDYAQQRGMAISYSFQGELSLLGRGAPPDVSVYSPEYAEALRPRIERAIETANRVPRLLNVQGYMDEPFQEGERTFDYSDPTAAEYERRFGEPLPRTEQVRDDPEAFLRYLNFRADYFPAGWWQSYAMVQEIWEREMPGRRRFWVELTHDSHNTFGAAAGPSGVQYAVDDVFHWGAPFDSVNYDIYPYLSRDYRTGKFAESPKPRLAGLHMAFAQMRNLARAHDKQLGFWLESGWRDKLTPESGLAESTWSPRELTYTAIGHGCDYLNTFWGIPEDERWWDEYGRVMSEVKACAPLLARSSRRPARACFIFPRTQHLLLQEEYWNVMVAYEAFLQAYGELDCVHEDQIAGGKLDEYEVVALFDVHCLPRAAAEVLRAWVEAGGLLIADEVPRVDERRQPLTVLEDVFGIRGEPSLSETPAALSVPEHPPLPVTRIYTATEATPLSGPPMFADGRPAFLVHQVGEGATLLMQFPLKDAYLAFLMEAGPDSPEFAPLAVIGQAVNHAGKVSGIHSSNPGIEACVRETLGGTLVLLLVNHECHDGETTVALRDAPSAPFVQDLVTGKAVVVETGEGGEVLLAAEVPFGTARPIPGFPRRPTGLTLTTEPQRAERGGIVTLTAGITGVAGTDGGDQLVDLDVRGPDQRLRQAFSGRKCSAGRRLTRSLELPVNAQRGRWSVRVSLPGIKGTAHASFRVR